MTIESLAQVVSQLVAKESGNVLGANQKTMVLSRLKKRLIDLGNLTPEAYHKYLKDNYEVESVHLITMLTTHHTFFFREFGHFEFIQKNIESIIARVKERGEKTIRVLSAACSKGQEVYSLAMFLEVLLKKHPGIDYQIMGTDIDPECIRIGDNGVYTYKEVKSIPQSYLSGNWQRGTGEISQYARVKKHIKEKCRFKVMNLMDIKPVLQNEKFDIIFCRNVFIYFDSPTILGIVKELQKHLYESCLLITGLSESLKTLDLFKVTHAPSVYSFTEPTEEKAAVSGEVARAKIVATPVVEEFKPLRVLAVDDSKSVLKLLTKIFESDPEFELVGTAADGLEAAEFLKNNEVDVMTLDIHMPNMDGVEYLKTHHHAKHPPVVVVSSASREDTRYAQATLKYGASDFVEKPALNNIQQKSDEIKIKLKMAMLNKEANFDTKFEKSYETNFSIQRCSDKGRVFFASFSDLNKVIQTIESFKEDQPPLFLVFEGNTNFLEMIKTEVNKSISAELYENGSIPLKNKVYICDFSEDFKAVAEYLNGKRTSVSVFGMCSSLASEAILKMDGIQLMLEDHPQLSQDLKEVASDIFPWTSFSHVGTEFLAKE